MYFLPVILYVRSSFLKAREELTQRKLAENLLRF